MWYKSFAKEIKVEINRRIAEWISCTRLARTHIELHGIHLIFLSLFHICVFISRLFSGTVEFRLTSAIILLSFGGCLTNCPLRHFQHRRTHSHTIKNIAGGNTEYYYHIYGCRRCRCCRYCGCLSRTSTLLYTVLM